MPSEAELRQLIKLENQLADHKKKYAALDRKNSSTAFKMRKKRKKLEEDIVKLQEKQANQEKEQLSASKQIDKMSLNRANKSQVNVLLGKKHAKVQQEMVNNENTLIKSLSKKIAGNESISELGNKLIDDVKMLNSGELDSVAIQERIKQLKLETEQLTDEEKEALQEEITKLQEILKARGENAEKIEKTLAITSVLNSVTGGLASKIMSMKKPTVAIGVAFGAALGILKKFSSTTDDIGNTFGALGVTQFRTEIGQAGIEGAKLGRSMTDITAGAAELATNFGFSFSEALKLSGKMTDFSKSVGMSNDEGAKLVGVLSTMTGLSAEGAINIAKQTEALAVQEGVAPTAVLKDIAASSAELALYSAETVGNFLEASVHARKLGVGIDEMQKMGKGLLNLQESLTAEFTAEVALGRELDFNKARQLFNAKDELGFQQEMVKQMGSQHEFQKLQVIEQDIMAAAFGTTADKMALMLSNQGESVSLAGQLSKMTMDNFVGEKAQSSLANLTGSLAELSLLMTETIGPIVDIVASKIEAFVKGLREGDAGATALAIGLGALTGAAMANAAANIFAGASKLFMINPVLGTAGVVGAGFIVASMLRKVRAAKSIGDGEMKAGQPPVISTAEGAFQLSKRDDFAVAPGLFDNNNSSSEGKSELQKQTTQNESIIKQQEQQNLALNKVVSALENLAPAMGRQFKTQLQTLA